MFSIGEYFYNMALNTKTDKSSALKGLDLSEDEKKKIEDRKKWAKENSKDVFIQSTNNGNLKLHAYLFENQVKTEKFAIVIHGYTDRGSGMAEYAKKFLERGYNVLAPDLRGHGESEGNYIGMGWHDRLDIIDWINYLISLDSSAKIILLGVSMGAATTMMTTGENLPSNVKLAIEDCGYTSAWDVFGFRLKANYHLPKFPVLYMANKKCKKYANYNLQEASSIEQLKKSKIPILFIHGNQDDFVPFFMLDKLYESKTGEKEKLVVNGAGHGMSSSVEPELYWETIDKFIEKYLNKE